MNKNNNISHAAKSSPQTEGGENLLSRWSRRKQQSSAESELEDQILQTQQPEAQVATLTDETENEAPVLTDEDMPPLESLNEDSDFSLFMSSGVSDKLRNLALRKLFNAPGFNIRDGLDEYDEDYTSFEKLGDLVTCDMKHQIEMQELKKQEQEAAEAEAEAEKAAKSLAESEAEAQSESEQPSAEDDATEAQDAASGNQPKESEAALNSAISPEQQEQMQAQKQQSPNRQPVSQHLADDQSDPSSQQTTAEVDE